MVIRKHLESIVDILPDPIIAHQTILSKIPNRYRNSCQVLGQDWGQPRNDRELCVKPLRVLAQTFLGLIAGGTKSNILLCLCTRVVYL
jgi:hypothetical protein